MYNADDTVNMFDEIWTNRRSVNRPIYVNKKILQNVN